MLSQLTNKNDVYLTVLIESPGSLAVIWLTIFDERICSRFGHSMAAAPTLLLLNNIALTSIHLFICGSYLSTVLRLELPSFPPIAYR